MGYTGIAEEELKNLIAKDFFAAYDCTHIIGKIDFTVAGAKGARPVRATSGTKKRTHTMGVRTKTIRLKRDNRGDATMRATSGPKGGRPMRATSE